MRRGSAERGLVNPVAAGVVAVLISLFAATSAYAGGSGGSSGSEHWRYKVDGFDYEAGAYLEGGHFPNATCTPFEDAFWEGVVDTKPPADETVPLSFGTASLKIGPHGTKGEIEATTPVTSTLSDAFHRETTACAEDGTETDSTTHVCNSALDSNQEVLVDFEAGVGSNRLTVLWNFFQDTGDGSRLVPNSFTCVEPFMFSEDDGCPVTKVPISKLNAKKVSLPFNCLAMSTTPPPGTNYTRFGTTVGASGTLHLLRLKK
jgi:hypothetical protein